LSGGAGRPLQITKSNAAEGPGLIFYSYMLFTIPHDTCLTGTSEINPTLSICVEPPCTNNNLAV